MEEREARTHLQRILDAMASGEIEVRNVDLDQEVVLDSRGERITEARAREIAQEVLQKVRRGRPSLSGGRKHSPQVSFRVPEDLAQRAEEVAAKQGKTLSQLGREALEAYLARAG